MHLIRLPCMELSEFANGPAQAGILSLQETTDLFLHFTAHAKPKVNYPIKARVGLKKQICHRLVCVINRNSQICGITTGRREFKINWHEIFFYLVFQ